MNADAVAAQIEKIHTEETTALFYNNEQALRSVIKLVYAEKYRLTDGVELLERAGVKVEYMNPDENISLE